MSTKEKIALSENDADICVIGERSDKGDHDDIFRSLRWASDYNSMFYNQQRIMFERDEKFGLKYRVGMSFESDESAGPHNFGKMRTSEAQFEVEYNPSRGYYYLANSQIPVNSDAPSIGIAHKWGIKGLLGGEHNYQVTEMKVSKRWFLGNWGIGKTFLKAGAVWNRVPYPLLLSPAANMSYVINDENFSLISSNEFINDRYTQLMLSWETNGNFVGSIPVLKRARLKEYFGIRMLWGYLTRKNIPSLDFTPWHNVTYRLMDKDRPIALQQMGSGSNWVGVHLIAMFALHKFFISHSRPVPGFLFLDQPSQVYFPSMEHKDENKDLKAVGMIYDFISDCVSTLGSKLQIIIMDHAQLDESSFTDHVIESWWDEDKNLVPIDWIKK